MSWIPSPLEARREGLASCKARWLSTQVRESVQMGSYKVFVIIPCCGCVWRWGWDGPEGLLFLVSNVDTAVCRANDLIMQTKCVFSGGYPRARACCIYDYGANEVHILWESLLFYIFLGVLAHYFDETTCAKMLTTAVRRWTFYHGHFPPQPSLCRLLHGCLTSAHLLYGFLTFAHL